MQLDGDDEATEELNAPRAANRAVLSRKSWCA